MLTINPDLNALTQQHINTVNQVLYILKTILALIFTFADWQTTRPSSITSADAQGASNQSIALVTLVLHHGAHQSRANPPIPVSNPPRIATVHILIHMWEK